MLAALRICRKDLFELLGDVRGVLFVFVLPSLILLLVGQLQTRNTPLQIQVAGTVDEADRFVYDELMGLLEEISSLEVSSRDVPALDPLAELRSTDLDLLLNLEGSSPNRWLFYTPETDRARLTRVRRIVGGLERALAVISAYGPEEDESREEELERFGWELSALGVFPPPRLVSYYPHASDGATDIILQVFILILCSLPFVLTAPGLFREREAHTLEPLLAAPGVGPGTLIVGKTLFAVVVTFFNFALMLVLAQSFYALHLKSGMLLMILFLLPAILSSALIGLTISALSKSQAQTVVSSAIYFLGLLLLTGFVYPLERASAVIRALAYLFPLTFVKPTLKGWMQGVQPLELHESSIALWVQCAVFAFLTLLAVRDALRRI